MKLSTTFGCRPALALVMLAVLTIPAAVTHADSASTAAPAETASLDLASISIEDLMNIKVDVASKSLENVIDTPSTVYVITAEDIQRYGYRTLADCLRRIPGMYVSSDRNYEYLGIRGYARPGDYNTRLLLLVDGHRINDPLYDMAPIGQDFAVDMQSVQQIEVAAGAGSALWGTNALLAVVNVIPKKGSDIMGTNLTAGYASHGAPREFMEYGSAAGEGLEISTSFSRFSSDGQQSIYFPDLNNPENNNGVAAGSDGESATRGYISAAYKGFGFFYDRGSRTKHVPTGSYGTVFNNNGNYTYDERNFTELSYQKTVSKKRDGRILLRMYSDGYDYLGDYLYDYGDPEPGIWADSIKARWWGGELRYSAQLSPRFRATAGVEYLSTTHLLQENHDGNPPYTQYAYITDRFSLRSFYAQAEVDLMNTLRLVAGTRLDDYSTGVSNWSPRLALIHSPSDSTRFKLILGRAFRAPNSYERSYHTNWELANPDLVSETNETCELAWEQQINTSHRLVVNAFSCKLDNIINQVTLPNDQAQFQNLDSAKSQGIETQLESRFASGLTSHLGLALVSAKDSGTGTRLTNAPALTVSGGISIPLMSGRLYVTPEIQYISSRSTLAGGSTGASAIVNLTVNTSNLLKGYDLSLSAYNLFNETAYVPGGQEHAQDRIPQDERTILVQLQRHL